MTAPGILRRIHNPRGRTCGCPPGCWCKRTRIGRLVRWWFPARYFGIHHHPVPPEWKREMFEMRRPDT
ncbi:MAG TPA: hypothetical protein VFI18_09835 [Gaiellales bacterium]|nr:hypothetical protein [Gaiellales bacterium]